MYFLTILWQAKILHYGSISLITEPCKSAHIAAAKAAKEAGVVLSYDPNLRLQGCQRRNFEYVGDCWYYQGTEPLNLDSMHLEA